MQNFDERNCEKIGELLEEIFKEYAAKEDSVTDEEFLRQMFARHLPKFSEEKIDEMCREIFESNRDMKNFLDEAKKSPGYENATQNWFCEKIKDSLDGGDYGLMQRLCIENEILDAINSKSLQISNDFDKIAEASVNKKDLPSAGETLSKEHHTEKKAASTTATNVHQAAFDTGVKKSIMTQYKKMMQLDFANLNIRTDISTVAASLSRNAALTGICGMSLTVGLSVLFKSSAVKQNFARFVLKTGTTDGLRVLVTGALKVGAERRILPLLTRATPMIALTAVALIAVESSKTMIQYVNGEIKCLEALNQVSKVSTSAICAVAFGVQGALVGAAAFAAVPIAAPTVGAFMGELVGTMAGYEIGRVSHANLKTFLLNAKNILTADYGILEMLTSETLTLTNKRKKKITI